MVSQRRIVIATAVAAFCASLAIVPPAFAGDEDISPNAYQVFDPETGFMVPADSLPDAQQGHPPADQTDAGSAAADAGQGSAPSRLLPLLLVAVIAMAGVAVWLRAKRKRAETGTATVMSN